MAILTAAARRRRQRRRNILVGLVKLLALALLLVLTAYSAFEAGEAKNIAAVERLRSDLQHAENERLELIAAKETAEERLRRMGSALARLEGDYNTKVPRGELARLLEAARARLADDIPPERLSFVVEHVTPERSCDDKSTTEIVQVRTPLSTELNNSVAFVDNRIVVSLDGEPLREADGIASNFFDPSAPISIRFLMINGDLQRVVGEVPLAKSIVLDGEEYQFQFMQDSRRGFVGVTMRRCDYP